jgi:Domain of unknown function (DUF5122) beta-propeller
MSFIVSPAVAQTTANEVRFDPSFGFGGELRFDPRSDVATVDRSTGRILNVTGDSVRVIEPNGSIRPGFPVLIPNRSYATKGLFRPDGSACVMYGSVNRASEIQCWNDLGVPTGPSVRIPGEFVWLVSVSNGYITSSGVNPVRLERRRPDGLPDPLFGNAGIVEIPTEEPAVRGSEAPVSVDNLGRFLIVGRSTFSVRRLLPNGSPDPSFGSELEPGLVRLNEGQFNSFVGDVGDGYLFQSNTLGVRTLQRLRYNGTLDASFGRVRIPNPVQFRLDDVGPISSAKFNFSTPIIGSDSMIYIVGSAIGPDISSPDGPLVGVPIDTVVLRFTHEGRPDLSFGDNGIVTIRRGTVNPVTRVEAVWPTAGPSFILRTTGPTEADRERFRRFYVKAGCPQWAGTGGVGPRQLDTRSGIGKATGAVGEGCTVTVPIANPNGDNIPNGSSVILNLTATQPTQNGFVTAWPSGQPRPTSSNLNFSSGQTIPNAAIVKLGTSNGVDLFNASGTTHLLADVNGILPPTQFTGLPPTRILDTRIGLRPIGPGQTITLRVVGLGTNAPANAAAVALNVTVTNPTATSFLTVWPSGVPTPNASNLNMTEGTTIANLVVVKPGADGLISIRNDSGSTDVIVDVNGYFVPKAVSTFVPERLLDTRNGIGAPVDAIGPGQSVALVVTGRGPVLAGATGSVVLNVTATDSTDASYVTVWPAGRVFPNSSNLNFVRGQTIPNLVIVPIGANGTVNLTNAFGSVHLIADISAYIPNR